MSDFILSLLISIAFICWGGYQYELGKHKVYSEWNQLLKDIKKRNEEREDSHD